MIEDKEGNKTEIVRTVRGDKMVGFVDLGWEIRGLKLALR